jgi:predicted transcriptional regulator
MPKPAQPPRPTDAELSILRVLWQSGPSTVREIHEILTAERPTGYTTVLKLLQIMAVKGLVHCDRSRRSHVFSVAATEGQTQRQLVRDLLERAFGGSASKLVLRALEAKRTSPEELRRIRQLLKDLEGGRKS